MPELDYVHEGVSLLTIDAALAGDRLARVPHVLVIVDIPQPIMEHAVEQLGVPHLGSCAPLHEKVRRIGHRFHSTRKDHLMLPARIAVAPIMVALRLDPHTLLMVTAGVVTGSPAPSAT